MDAIRRIVAVNHGVDSFDQDAWFFLVHRHNHHGFWGSPIIQHSLYPFASTQRIGRENINAAKPRADEKDRKSPECKGLKPVDHLLRDIKGNLGRQRQGHKQHREEDETRSSVLATFTLKVNSPMNCLWEASSVPNQRKQHDHDECEGPYTPMICLGIYHEQAVNKSCEPQ
jgi:hypothetical protein